MVERAEPPLQAACNSDADRVQMVSCGGEDIATIEGSVPKLMLLGLKVALYRRSDAVYSV